MQHVLISTASIFPGINNVCQYFIRRSSAYNNETHGLCPYNKLHFMRKACKKIFQLLKHIFKDRNQ